MDLDVEQLQNVSYEGPDAFAAAKTGSASKRLLRFQHNLMANLAGLKMKMLLMIGSGSQHWMQTSRDHL